MICWNCGAMFPADDHQALPTVVDLPLVLAWLDAPSRATDRNRVPVCTPCARTAQRHAQAASQPPGDGSRV